MCELTLEAAGMTREEIEALPTRKTWYGVVGTVDSALNPDHVSDDAEYAKHKAGTLNKECPLSGPWSVVVMTENLRMQP